MCKKYTFLLCFFFRFWNYIKFWTETCGLSGRQPVSPTYTILDRMTGLKTGCLWLILKITCWEIRLQSLTALIYFIHIRLTHTLYVNFIYIFILNKSQCNLKFLRALCTIRQTRGELSSLLNISREPIRSGDSHCNLYYQNRHRCVIFSSIYIATEL